MMSLRRWRMWSVLSLVGALAVVAGCAEESGATRDPETADGVAQSPLADKAKEGGDKAHGPRGPHARRHPGGPDHLLVAALNELELTDAQKTTIQAALEKMQAGPKDRGPKDRSPFAALAAGVRAGKIDTSIALEPGGPPPGFEEHRAAAASALQTLHATLTKEQRSALVGAVAKRMEEHGPKGDRGPGGEHGCEDGPPDGEGARGEGPREGREGARGGMPRGMGPLGHLLGGLDLKDAQREAIDRALAAQKPAAADHEAMKQRFEAMHTQMRARLDGFAADSFDAKAFLTHPEGDKAAGPMPHHARMVKDLAVVVSILEPAQREKLATLLEKGPPEGARPHMGHPGMRGPRPAPAR